MGTGLVNVDLREGEGMRDIKQVFHYGPITSMKIPSQALHRILYSDLKTGARGCLQADCDNVFQRFLQLRVMQEMNNGDFRF